MNKLYWLLHRAYCAAFHHRHFDLAKDYRGGIKDENRRDVVYCTRCNFTVGRLLSVEEQKLFSNLDEPVIVKYLHEERIV